MQVFANNLKATLSGAVNDSVTTFNLNTGEGASFPTIPAGDFLKMTLAVGPGNETGEVVIADRVHDQQTDGAALTAVFAMIDLQVCAEDRLDALCGGRLVKFHQPVKVAGVGDRHGRHAVLGHRPGQILDTNEPVAERILRVHA